VQYAQRFNVDKTKAWFVDANAGELPKSRIKPRLASAADSERLTGYHHGGVTPIAVATPELPILLSHRVVQLSPPILFLGAQDVDLKVCVRVQDFVACFKPAIADVTDE
jgi:prolyl-tRNA editing enzyme YbaK/EbsC (Cys-tRNA(Pro) deacylase)